MNVAGHMVVRGPLSSSYSHYQEFKFGFIR
jgi:hypothetical protein